MNWIIKLVFPQKNFPEKTVCITTYRIPITNSCSTIYDAVASIKNKEIVYGQKEKKQNHMGEIIELRNVLNIHNDSGIKNITQIKFMAKIIKLGEHLVSAEKIPNIKIIKVNHNQWLLFDGHHSMLAYIHTGKKYLHEVAYLTVETEGAKNIAHKDIVVFFGHHANNIRDKDWRNYAINWQAPQNKQLCPRIQKNMGELYDVLSAKITAQ